MLLHRGDRDRGGWVSGRGLFGEIREQEEKALRGTWWGNRFCIIGTAFRRFFFFEDWELGVGLL